jgi:hypothetical protein
MTKDMTHKQCVTLARRVTLAIAICLPGFAFILLTTTSGPERPAPSPEKPVDLPDLENDPIALHAESLVGLRGSWRIDVDKTGQADVTIYRIPRNAKRRFQVSTKQLSALRQVLQQEEFFRLDNEYGRAVPDGGESILSVTAGNQSKTVKLYFTYHESRGNEIHRARRLFALIRSWFADMEPDFAAFR